MASVGYNVSGLANDSVLEIDLNDTSRNTSSSSEHEQLPAAVHIALAAAAVAGVVGNLLIILSVVLTPRQRKRSNILVTNLAVADVIVCAVVIPLVLVTSLYDASTTSRVLRVLVSWLAVTCCVASVVTSVLIAVERYFHICHIVYYRKVFVPKYIGLFAASAWSYALILATVCAVIASTSGCDVTRTLHCVVDTQRGARLSVALVALIVLLPVCVIAFCYFSILHLVCRNRSALRGHERANRSKPPMTSSQLLVQRHTAKSRSPTHSSRRRARSRRSGNVELMLLTIILFFLVFWSPLAVVILYQVFGAHLPRACVTAGAWLALCNSAANSFVYGVLNTNFRQTYVAILTRIFCCRQPATTQMRAEHGELSNVRAARDQLHSQFSLSNTMWKLSGPSTRSDLTHSKVSSGDLQIFCETTLRNGASATTPQSAKYGAFLDVPTHAGGTRLVTSSDLLAAQSSDVSLSNVNIPAIRISMATASCDSSSAPAES